MPPLPVFITCAVTGNHTTREANPALPVTPNEIAESSLAAGEAGAAIVHLHVRDPVSGAPSMDLRLYADVCDQIRRYDPALIINLTTGPGGRYHPSDHDPAIAGERTNLLVPARRVEHVIELRPDIATLDLNTMTFGREVVINTPSNVVRMGELMLAAGVRPELELFDSGDIALARDLIAAGRLPTAPLCSIVMGVKYGFQPSPETVLYARAQLPDGALWTAFGTGRSAFPMVAQSFLAGGKVRVGLEDAVYLSQDTLAPDNASMVAKAKHIVEDLGGTVATAVETRRRLQLRETSVPAAGPEHVQMVAA